MDRSLRPRPAPGVRRLLAVSAAALVASGCASFPDSAPSFSGQPSLTPPVVTLVAPSPLPGNASPTPTPPSTSTSDPGSQSDSSPTPGSQPSDGSARPDPCAPPELPVVAVCLDDPWGLAPLPDGQSALVGERTTGRILRVAPQHEPTLVAHIDDLDTSAGGGLLGIALSPYFAEDDLLYAYVSTATDNRVLRIAPGEDPKAIFTGIPKGRDGNNGGAIAFGADDLLYVTTGGGPADGSAGAVPTTATTPPRATSSATPSTAAPSGPTGGTGSSLAGAVLRLDAFGKPAADNPGGSPVFASGLVDPTGICPLPGGAIGVVDHRPEGDMLIPVRPGADYRTLASGDTLWIYRPGDGGATDCAVSTDELLATSLTGRSLVRIEMRAAGGFTGSPTTLLDDEYGRLRTVVAGTDDLVWLTTANRHDPDRDAQHPADPSDDRVIILPSGGSSGGDGGLD